MEAGELTWLLKAWRRGDDESTGRLWGQVHGELRRLAAYHWQRERRDHTLQPTAVVHEVYLRLIDQKQVEWRDRAHFMGACANMIRRVLVDHARARNAVKRGAELTRVTLDTGIGSPTENAVDAIDLESALQELTRLDERQGRIVELRFFGGLSVDEAAEVLGVSAVTVKREWAMARAWLYRQLNS